MTDLEHHELRARLARRNPMPDSVPVALPTQTLLERAMLTTEPTPDTSTPVWRRPALVAAAAVTVIAVGVGGIVALDSSNPSSSNNNVKTLALTTAQTSGAGTSSSSCIPFSVDVLKDMPLAFAGTVTQVSSSTIQIAVDRWYKGGDADVVTVALPPGNISVDPVDFVEGKRYLVTATDGTVNSCGYTGEATPDLAKAFNEAFGA